MKKIILLATVLLFSLTSSAQKNYGVRAAFNISNLDLNPDISGYLNEHRNGFAVGFFVEYELSKSVSVLPELQFSEEGGNTDALKADYLNLPIQLRFNFGDDFAIGVGPQMGLKIWQNSDLFRTFTFSGIVGAEYNITSKLFVDARYSYGFTNVFEKDLIYEAKNSVIQFGFGIKID